MLRIEENPVIAAVRSNTEFFEALKSGVNVIFLLSANIFELNEQIKAAHEKKKYIFVHVDMMDGIGKDRTGIEYLSKCGIDGVISTRISVIKAAAGLGLRTIQRFFIVDSQSVETAKAALSQFKPDMVEIMPFQCASYLSGFCKRENIRIIAGGLVQTKRDIFAALENGVEAVSTGKGELWDE